MRNCEVCAFSREVKPGELFYCEFLKEEKPISEVLGMTRCPYFKWREIVKVGRGPLVWPWPEHGWKLAGKHETFALASISALMERSRKVRQFWGMFKRMFPGHPTPVNTYMALVVDEEGRARLFWLCEHFEYCTPNELAGLAFFAKQLELEFGGYQTYVMADGSYAEKLIIEVIVVDRRQIPVMLRKLIAQA